MNAPANLNTDALDDEGATEPALGHVIAQLHHMAAQCEMASLHARWALDLLYAGKMSAAGGLMILEEAGDMAGIREDGE
jgi:hypothetical protein